MNAELRLNLPWLPSASERLGDLVLHQARDDVLVFDDGITLEVRVLDPSRYPSAEALRADVNRQSGPGRVMLVAGALPVAWRAELRQADVSFLDTSGVVEINWPRVRVSTARFAHTVERQRSPIPLQKGYAVVLQELLVATAGGNEPTISELARCAHTSLSTASRAVSQLADHGLVSKARDANHVRVTVVQRAELADQLAKQTKWPGQYQLPGYRWGRNVWETAQEISAAAVKNQLNLAVTGRVGAAFLGTIGTSSPSEVKCWVNTDERHLAEAATLLAIEPAPPGEANVILSTDRWGVGVHRARTERFQAWHARTANPVRLWCDLHSEDRGMEFASHLWDRIDRG